MAEKRRRLIDDLLQDDFFGIKEEEHKKEEPETSEAQTQLFEEEEIQAAEESTSKSGTLFDEEELIEDTEESEAPSETTFDTEGDLTSQKEEPAAPGKKKGGFLLILLILIILAGGGGAAYLYFVKGTNPLTLVKQFTSPGKETTKPAAKGTPPSSQKATAKKTEVKQPEKTESSTPQPQQKTAEKTSTTSPQPEKEAGKTVQSTQPKTTTQPEKKGAESQPTEKTTTPIQMPKYSLKAGPFPDRDLAEKWAQSLKARGLETTIVSTSKTVNLFYINAGEMDKAKAEALKLKIKIFMPDQADKITLTQKGNKVIFYFGPYKSATMANSVIARLQTPKLNVQGKLVSKPTKQESYYLKIGKFTTRKEATKTATQLNKLGLKVEVTGL